MQPGFSAATLIGCLLLCLAIDLFRGWTQGLPDRQELGPRIAELRFDRVSANVEAGAPFRVAGAWKVGSNDPRVGGVSGLAVDSDGLVALTDRGALIRFPKPFTHSVRASLRELPGGPHTADFNAFRDSEAMIEDPQGRGWWVAFESVDQLWLFDRPIRGALQSLNLRSLGLPTNWGIEGLARDGNDLLLFAENGRNVIRIGPGRRKLERIAGSGRPISDVAAIGGGRFIAVERRVTPLGFANALVLLAKTADGYTSVWRVRFGTSAIDNFEAIAVDRSAGRTRLWLMTDDAFQRPFRTVLLALDVSQ